LFLPGIRPYPLSVAFQFERSIVVNGVCTTLRLLFAFFRDFECKGDLSTAMLHVPKPGLLQRHLRTVSGYAIRNEPLSDLNNQKNKKYVVGEGEMELKVFHHKPDNQGRAVAADGVVGGLKACEETQPRKTDGSYRCVLQIFEALAEAANVRRAPNTQHCRC